MSSKKTPLEIEAPAPLEMFRRDVIHPDNLELAEGDQRARPLTKKRLKELKAKRAECAKVLDKYHYDEIRQRIQDIKSLYQELNIQSANTDDPTIIKAIKRKKWKLRQRVKRLKERIEPVKPFALMILKIDQRIKEHEVALSNAILYQRLQREMAKEVVYFALIIKTTYTRLGYCHRYTLGTKNKIDQVRFERFVVTEDEIQFKLYVSSLTLFDKAKSHLPTGVRAWDLIRRETLTELTIACEREVTSPHVDDDGNPFKGSLLNGAWIVINRLGLTDGLFNHIDLSVIMARYQDEKQQKIPLPYGVRRGRIINWVYLSDHPHVFINGQTGTGKSNLMHVILSTLITKHSPDELRLILIDLKEGLDFTDYESVPHLLFPIIDNLPEVERVLSRVEKLRVERGHKIRGIGKNIDQYNARVASHKRMPRIIIFIDEYNSINAGDKSTRQNINALCTSLAEKARAVGIHLVLGTQAPFGDVIPKTIRSNISLTMTGKQRTIGASISTLGHGGARKLGSVRGRMLCDNGAEVFQVQTPFCSNEAIAQAIEDAQNWQTPREFILPGVSEQETVAQITEIEKPAFTVDDFLRIAINEFNGVISPRKMFDHTNQVLSLRTLQRMADEIKQANRFEFEGTIYDIKPYGKGYQIVNTENTETALNTLSNVAN